VKKFLLAVFLVLLFAATPALADEITFSFIGNSNLTNVEANSSGLTVGPALNIAISNATTGVSIPLAGLFNSSTGAATFFAVTPNLVVATYAPGGTDSVSIVDPITHAVLISGVMNDSSALLAHIPGGSGSFRGTFDVTDVSSTILSEFGLASFDPNGSVGFTFGQDSAVGGTLSSVIGGGSVTFVATPLAPTPEASTMLLMGSGLIFISWFARKVNLAALRRREVQHG
jgi:hypothetical protein